MQGEEKVAAAAVEWQTKPVGADTIRPIRTAEDVRPYAKAFVSAVGTGVPDGPKCQCRNGGQRWLSGAKPEG